MALEALIKHAAAEDLLRSKPVFSGWLKKRNKVGKCQLFII